MTDSDREQVTIAFVEDDPVIRANMAEVLSEHGYRVEEYANKEDAKKAFSQALPDLALLDISLGRDHNAGYELCGMLRGLSDTLPIVFLTGHDEDLDKISGMRVGADDYLTKGTNIQYLLVRIDALLRRVRAYQSQSGDAKQESAQSHLRLDKPNSQAYWRNELLKLPLTHYWVLEDLALHPGQVRSHRVLMKAANMIVEDNTVIAYVKKIRDVLRASDADFACIKTERNRGYRWVETG